MEIKYSIGKSKLQWATCDTYILHGRRVRIAEPLIVISMALMHEEITDLYTNISGRDPIMNGHVTCSQVPLICYLSLCQFNTFR